MARITFHTDSGAGALQKGCLMLMPAVDTRESSPGEQQMATTTIRPVSPAGAIDPELRHEVAAFVATLPCQQRTALLLRLRRQVGYAEIASTLDCTEHEARSFVYDALRSLRAHLCDRL